MCYIQGPWLWSLDAKRSKGLLFLEMLSGVGLLSATRQGPAKMFI